MAKKQAVKKIRPIEAAESLIEFNNRVIMLLQSCDFVLKHSNIDESIKSTLESSVNEVREFYTD